MSLKVTHFGGLGCVLAAAGLSLWARTRLPDAPIATHFDLAGHANGYMARDTALAFGPGLILIVWLVLSILPAISPKRASLDRSGPAYGMVSLAILLFILMVHGVILATALGIHFELMRVMHGGLGLLFLIIGNFLPKMRYNYFMGIRTPWTLSDERVWDKTHRAAGLWFMLGGLAVIVSAFVAPAPVSLGVMFAGILVPVLVSLVYSYLVARRLKLA